MKRPRSAVPLRSLVVGLACLAASSLGCDRAPSADDSSSAPNPAGGANGAAARTPAAPAQPPQSITNHFGMTFRLIAIEPKPADDAPQVAEALLNDYRARLLAIPPERVDTPRVDLNAIGLALLGVHALT